MKTDRITNPETHMKIADLFDQYEELKIRLGTAEDTESAAKSNCISILNELNTVGKKIDAAIADQKKASPHSSDWHREARGRGATIK